MSETAASRLVESVDRIASFTGKSLAGRIADLEFSFMGMTKAKIANKLQSDAINRDLLIAAKEIKRAAAQIDVVLHAIGILVLLDEILGNDEVVESLSLGAGSSEAKRFDLETNLRVAEFTFIDWRGNDNTRLQKIFKDFFRLVEHDTDKKKQLWVSDDTYVLKYFRSNSSVRSATHKHRDVWETFSSKYSTLKTVADYYRLHQSKVELLVYRGFES